MALSIRDPEADRLARELAALTGETVTQAIKTALQDRLRRERKRRSAGIEAKLGRPRAIQARLATLPVLDDRAPDEIIGDDEHGLPRR